MSDRTQPTVARRRKTRIRAGAGIIATVVTAVILVHVLGARRPRRTPPAQVVSAAVAATGNMPETLDALGTVTPVATVNVLPQLSGYLIAVGYQEGQNVKKGQFLAQIDPRQYEISKQQAEAQRAKDQASLAQARSDLARYTQLHQQHSIAEQTYVDQRFLVQQDEAAVRADQASIAQYELDISYCHITAPIAGVVGLRLVDPGNYVTASSSPGIVTITTMSPTTVEFSVPQNALGQILQRVNTGAKLLVSIWNSDNSQQLATGTLYAISNQTATGTGTVTLRATVPNRNEALFPNEFVNVRLLVDTLQNAVLVPTPAVQSGAPGDYVFLVNANDTVSVHKVTLGPGNGKDTVIFKGLKAGQTVVTDGTDRLSDGARIKVAGAKPSSAGRATAAAPAVGGGQGRRTHRTSAPAGSQAP